MNTQQLVELVKDLELTIEPVTLESVRSEIRKQIVTLHPDRNGGSFSSDDDEKRYHQMIDALNLLSDPSLPIPIGMSVINKQLQEIDNQLKIIRTSHLMESEQNTTRKYKDSVKNEARKYYTTGKIGSMVFCAICAAILTLSKSLKDNLLFGFIGKSPMLLMLLGFVFATAGITFAFLWLKEYRAGRFVEWLLSDYGLSVLLRRVVGYGSRGDEEVLVTKSALIDEMLELNRPWAPHSFIRWFKKILRPHLPTAICENIAGRQLQDLLNKQVIFPKGRRGIETVYVLEKAVVNDLIDGSYYDEKY